MKRSSDAFRKTANTVAIEILEAEYADLGREWHKKDMCSPYSRLYYVISGEGYLKMQGKEDGNESQCVLRPGYLYLIPNGLTYDYFCEDRLEKVYFHINVILPNGMDLFHGCTRFYELPVERQLPDQMRRWLCNGCSTDVFSLQGEIYHAIGAFTKQAELEGKINRRYSPLVKGIFDLQPELKISTTARQIAERLNVSESTMSKKFRRETGMSIGGYREQLTMSRARQLLATDSGSVREIADRLGFSDQFYFCKYFKQRQGMTPSMYRKKYRTDN